MANATNLPGIIGQAYEDRRNGDSGKLISRDEKCKTLTFQSDDGNSFVKSYSHFRSYMRKKADVPEEEIKEEAYAEAELTSVEVSEADAEKMEKNAKRKAKAAEKAKADVESKEKKISLDSVKSEVFESTLKEYSKAVDSLPDGSVRLSADMKKKIIKFSLYNRKQFDLYVHARNGISKFIVQNEKFISSISDIAVAICEVKPESGRKTNVGNYIVSVNNSDLIGIAKIIREFLIEMISDHNTVNVESEA